MKNKQFTNRLYASRIKKRLKKKLEISDLSLAQLKEKKRLLPKKLFNFSLRLHRSSPYSYFVLESYRLHLLQLGRRAHQSNLSVEEDVGHCLERLPMEHGAADTIKAYLDLCGKEGRYAISRTCSELKSATKIALVELEVLRGRVLSRNPNVRRALLPQKKQIERDIVTVLVQASGRLDSINAASHNFRDPSFSVHNAIELLLPHYERHDLEESLDPSSFLFSKEIIEINLRDFTAQSWEDVDIYLPRSFFKQFDPSVRIERGKLGAVYEYIKPKANLSDVVLPDAIKADILALCEHHKLREKQKRSPALSFLFAGPPGTGKTWTAEAIAGYFGRNLLKVAFSEISARDTAKIVAYFVARAKASNSVLLFDECEDMFSNYFLGMSDAWAKTLFEKFEGIAVFTTNYGVPKGIDRRMTYIVEYKNPTPLLRERILGKEFENLKEKGIIKQLPTKKLASALAKEYSIPGGYYKSALQLALAKSMDKKTNPAANKLKESAVEDAFKTVQARLGKACNDSIREPSIRLTDVRLAPELQNQVKRFIEYGTKLSGTNQSPLLPKAASAVFSGPPGTGKTITAEAIAHEMGLNFRRVSPSTFMSPWFGETESNIRKIFREAEQERYLLFIDEAEGMLGDRQADVGAIRHTIINEFLQQIEAFKGGILIIATNHTDMMDHAFGRRFLFHMHFTIPDAKTRLALWKDWQKELKLSDSVLAKLAQTYGLSGGEIRNVAIKAGVNGNQSFEEIGGLCEKAYSERTGIVKKRIGIQG